MIRAPAWAIRGANALLRVGLVLGALIGSYRVGYHAGRTPLVIENAGLRFSSELRGAMAEMGQLERRILRANLPRRLRDKSLAELAGRRGMSVDRLRFLASAERAGTGPLFPLDPGAAAKREGRL